MITQTETDTIEPIVLDSEQAARRLNISTRSLARLVKENRIPTGKILGRRVFILGQIDQWAQEQCTVREVA